MKFLRVFFVIGCCAGLGVLLGAPLTELQKDQLLQRLDAISKQQKELTQEVDQLRHLLGRQEHLDDLKPLPPAIGTLEDTRLKLEQGNKAFLVKQYREAKEAYQAALELSPDDTAANYNLGLAHFQLGNPAMAKRMLKSALDLDAEVQGTEQIRAFLTAEEGSLQRFAVPDVLKPLRTELINLKQEAESYAASRALTRSERTRQTVKALRQMETLAGSHRALQKEYLREIAQLYAKLDLFDKAMQTYRQFELVMEGEILPEGYHSEVLEVEEKQKALSQVLKSYRHNKPEQRIRKALKKDLKELDIFAVQLDEFVDELTPEDPDFQKIAERLAEFRWGKQPGRHVIVLSRFEDLVYSSLPGTLPLERYQDSQGRQFLRHITMLADEMQLKDSEFFEVNLSAAGRVIPYVVMYTYIPKHEAFIVVRLPKEELTEV